MALNKKQKRFADEWLIDMNATQAAIRAGYSEKSAYSQGSRLLKDDEVRAYIAQTLEEQDEYLVAKQREVLRYLTRVMRRDETESIVVTLKTERTEYVPDENGVMRKRTIKTEEPQVVEIPSKLMDANKAAELLARRYGILDAKDEEDIEDMDGIRSEVFSGAPVPGFQPPAEEGCSR